MFIQLFQHPQQIRQVTPTMAQQVMRHLVGQLETARARMLVQRLRFLPVVQSVDLIHQPPAQTGAQIVAQLQMGRRRRSAHQQHPRPFTHRVIQRKQRNLRRDIEFFHIIHRHDLRDVRHRTTGIHRGLSTQSCLCHGGL